MSLNNPDEEGHPSMSEVPLTERESKLVDLDKRLSALKNYV